MTLGAITGGKWVLSKLDALREGEWQPWSYPDTFAREQTTGTEHLKSLVLDELLESIDDEEVAVFVPFGDVSRVNQPASSITACVSSAT